MNDGTTPIRAVEGTNTSIEFLSLPGAVSRVLTGVPAILGGGRFFDANGDEYPDLYVVDMHSDMWIDYDQIDLVQAKEKFNTPLNTVKTWLRRSMIEIRGCLGLG